MSQTIEILGLLLKQSEPI